MQSSITNTIDPRAFRATMGRFATGVTVVTTQVAGQIHGMTANAFVSVSLAPPLVLVSIGQKARMHRLLALDMPLGISVLGAHQTTLSDHFAGRGNAAELSWQWADDIPLLAGAIAQIAGNVVALYPAGDHTLVVVHVALAAHSDDEPLLFHAGSYTKLRYEQQCQSTGTR